MQEFYIVNPDIIFRDEGEEGGILFNPATGAVKLLNECAAIIFKCLDGNHTKQQIINTIQTVFPEIERSVLEQDVSEFITEGKEKQLIGILLD